MAGWSDPMSGLYTAVEPWRNVWEYLATALRALPQTDWKPQFPTPSAKQSAESDKAAIRETILAQAKTSAQSIGLALEQYAQSKRWPSIPPESVYWLRLMHADAMRFVGCLGVRTPEGPKTIFPFPNATAGEVAVWLLVDWWLDNGLRDYAIEQTSEETLFFRYFA
jgi:hypothetical protein